MERTNVQLIASEDRMKHCYILLRRKQQHLLQILVLALFIHNL